MFNETTRETLINDISEARTQGEILKNSADFLLNKLNNLSKSDNELSGKEITIIEKQLDYHKKMLKLKSDFDIKKELMRSNTKKSILNLLAKMDGNSIVDTDLLDLQCRLEQGLFSDSRSIIDSKTNNTDLSIEGLLDGLLNYDVIGKFEKTNNLLNYFTLELLENNILIDENRNISQGQIPYSKLSIIEIKNHINNTICTLIKKKLTFPDSIEIKHGSEFIRIDLIEIRNEVENKILQEKNTIEKKRLQEERKNNKEYLLGLLNGVFNNTIDADGRNILNIKFDFDCNTNEIDSMGYIRLFNSYISEGFINKQNILDFYEENKISKELLLNFLEQDPNFNYLEFINEYGLTKRVQEIGLWYAKNELNMDIYDESSILENLHIFVSIFLEIESSGFNVSNKNNSGAEGYFQFKTNNGELQKDGSLKGGSFRTALNRIKNRIDSDNPYAMITLEEFKDRFGGENILSERLQDPKRLSAENQTILFLGDLFGKDRNVRNQGIDLDENGLIDYYESLKNGGVDINKDGILDDKELLRKIGNKLGIDIDKNGEISKGEELFIERRPLKLYLKDILINNNEWALGRVYELIHHTNPDEKTIKVFKRVKSKYLQGNKLVLAKSHY